MPVPNYAHVPQKLFDTGLFNLHTHEGQGAFVDACVSVLHGIDENFVHLRKSKGQTNVHLHAEDAALYKQGDGTAIAIDFVTGAGGENPRPSWQVKSGPNDHVYSDKDVLDPTGHGTTVVAPAPTTQTFGYPDENTVGRKFLEALTDAYNDAGRAFPDPNDKEAYWHFARYGYSSRGMPAEHAVAKHISELRGALGV